jgi:hypothetical protein
VRCGKTSPSINSIDWRIFWVFVSQLQNGLRSC